MSTVHAKRKRLRTAGFIDDFLPAVDPLVKALLHFNGVNGSTTFIDETGRTWAANGAAALATGNKKFGTASLGLTTTSYASAADSDDFHLSTLDWTFDFWIRFASLAGTQNLISQNQDANNWMDMWVSDSGTKLWFQHNSGGVATASLYGTTAFAINTWYHVAFERFSNICLVFIDGVSKTITVNTTIAGKNLSNLNAPLYINTFNGSNGLSGWIDEFRFSKEIARWTTNFTPPADEYTYP